VAGETVRVDAILVTGAGRRIGLHLAERLLAAGHPVIAHYRTETEGVARLRAQGIPCIAGDLADEGAVTALIEAVRSHASSLRAIIHNASAFRATADEPHAALAQLDEMMAVHVRAPYALNTALAPLLRACTRPHADIVQISDIFADNPNPTFDVYCASKAAAQNLALSFAKRLAPKVKVNVIQPGPILFQPWHADALRKKILAESLLGTEGGAEAIGLAVEALLANHFQTGAVVAVDGGRRIGQRGEDA
jgi:dihydromonapterin reductase/dihydrofolate reductase